MEGAVLRNRLGEIKKALKLSNKKKNQQEEAIQVLESLQDKIKIPFPGKSSVISLEARA